MSFTNPYLSWQKRCKMKTWIKGGLIGGIILLVLFLIWNLISLFILGHIQPGETISNFYSGSSQELLGAIVIGFVIGAIVGMITSKSKGKKKK